jgi:hypothetical protein
MVELITLFLALFFSLLFINVKIGSILNFIILKIDDNRRTAIINFILLLLSSLFISVYCVI